MKLQELYSLTAGQKIDRIHTIPKYFPIPFEKYIVIQPWSKPSKNYDFWDETLNLIKPILDKENVKLIQVGAKDEKPLNHCHHLMGQTNWGQLEYIISKSELVLSADSVSSHLAGHFDKNLVVLISNNFKETVSPYFGSKEKQIILEPDRTNKNPSFTLDEGTNKQINEIKPEIIASSVCKLLNLEFSYPYKSISIGNQFNNKIAESVVDSVIDTGKLGLQSLIMRADYNFNLNILFQQAQICKVAIVTDKELPIEPLIQLRPNIIEVLYKVTKNHNPLFVKNLQQAKIPYRLFSELKEEDLNPIKLDYLDLGIVFRKEVKIPDFINDKKYKNIHYKSSKFLLGNGKIYQSLWDYKSDRAIPSFESVPLQLIDINLEDLVTDLDYLYFLQKI